MRICLIEDPCAHDLEPLALTRAVFDLRCGIHTLAEKYIRIFAPEEVLARIRDDVRIPTQALHPSWQINSYRVDDTGRVLVINARWLPPVRLPRGFNEDIRSRGFFLGEIGGEFAYGQLPGTELEFLTTMSFRQVLSRWSQIYPRFEVCGSLVQYPWDLIRHNSEQIAADFAGRTSEDGERGRPAQLTRIGPADGIRIHPTARIDPFVVIDSSNGPVVIDRDAVISSFTFIEGPCFIGARSQVRRASIRGGTSIGPNCRIGGEIEASIVHGNSNKYHDGFLGHSYVGEWVNMGAGCQTSDLRNDYGEVTMRINQRSVETGERKIGSFVGDHAKIGLGCLLNTGSTVGPFAELLPADALLPRTVPAFCRVAHGRIVELRSLEVGFVTAERMLARRGERFSIEQRQFFQQLWAEQAASRREFIREAERRRLRKSA